MPRIAKLFLIFTGGLLAFGAASGALAIRSTTAQATLLAAVNATRTQYGLGPLRVDATLQRAAASHSAEMLHDNYFAHGDFRGRMIAFHVRAPAAGEDLAWGNGAYADPGTIVAEWLASPEHRANLLRPGFTRIGIGIANGTFLGNGEVAVVTADFAGS
jgi:uncharacterized protein YkwD